jgi:hypothetical protein
MATFITAIGMKPSNSNYHEHITHVKWEQEKSGNAGVSTTPQMIDYINSKNRVYVRDGLGVVEVYVVNGHPDYLRTYADGKPTNNLLNLPRI